MDNDVIKTEKQPPIKQKPVDPEQTNLSKPEQTNDEPIEVGGPVGLEPTRYGDWEKKGRCIDF